jgi:phosphotransferase system  glucose/maltose/N-acetylglucosamine-specific IIC component
VGAASQLALRGGLVCAIGDTGDTGVLLALVRGTLRVSGADDGARRNGMAELIGSVLGFGAAVGLIWAPFALMFCAGTAAEAAQSKGRSGFAWGLAGLLFGPLALLAIAAYAAAPASRAAARSSAARGGFANCPRCRATVLVEANACPNCDFDLRAAAS